ncbi:MAG: tRNA (N6-isopentenyl adenosine(37)-C2)-methylthiotransferase MiaB, partial [Chitinophagaceae bacterium]|nr:tRNA (N6-isopentenyl adenosine(37)-C2)-methylthiotransferase MiaB [Chitinophagaceae bacterium]
MEFLYIDKTHDEARQGEVYQSQTASLQENGKLFFIESYGCAMNFSDSEVIASILQNEGFSATSDETLADLILINTCSVREKAEQTVRRRLSQFNKIKKNRPGMLIGVLGCMAERLKSAFL